VVRSDFESPPGGPRQPGQPAGAAEATLIRVDDPVEALGRLAQYYRRAIIAGSVTVVAVTGSNGKTTTKEMIAHVLRGRWPGRAAIKSFNNHIGVPLTLLSVEPADTFVVCELGMNAPGEIAALARLAQPDVAVITGVSEAHLEGLGSLERIAAEKLSILRHLPPVGCGVVNADHEILRRSLERDHDLKRIKAVTFGQWAEADLRLTDMCPAGGGGDGGAGAGTLASGGFFRPAGVEFTVNNRFVYRLNVPGRHNVFNALAAIGVARRFGMDHEEIAGRLASFELPAMRLEFARLGRLTLINDAYNANPASMQAAVSVLVDTPAARRRVLVLGDMRELGSASERLHRQVAEVIGTSGVDVVISVGDYARLVAGTVRQASGGRIETHAYATTTLAKRRLVSFLRTDDTVLVKGSRALGLERLVETIQTWAHSAGANRSAGTRSTPKRPALGKPGAARHVPA